MAAASSSSSDLAKGRMIRLRSSDGEEFEVAEAVAAQSQTIRQMIEDGCAYSTAIPVANVTASILSKVLEYCKKHVVDSSPSSSSAAAERQEEVKSWDAEFMRVDQPVLFDLILAANYLDIKGLLHLGCQTVADMMKGKTPEEIRKHFNIENDFTPEEEEELRREIPWAFAPIDDD